LFLSANPTLEQLLEVQEHFGLPSPALVEKDWHVVKALAAIAAVDTGDFRLVFGGGTALSRAYKLTKRMSEDVDLKIVRDKAPTRGELRKLRNKITDALLGAGLSSIPRTMTTTRRCTKAGTPSTRCLTGPSPGARVSCGPMSRLKRRCFRSGVMPWTSP
jgi:hypothetical protein